MGVRVYRGFRLNEQSAIRIGEASEGERGKGLGWWSATLFKAPKSENYFLVGKGAFMTRFARGEVSELTFEQAEEWALEYLGKALMKEDGNECHDESRENLR